MSQPDANPTVSAPFLRVSDDGRQPSRTIRRIVDQLVIHCPIDGCKSISEISRMEKHLSACPFRRFRCKAPGCGEELQLISLKTHALSCPKTATRCKHCNQRLLLCELDDHCCPSCPNIGCEALVALSALPEHRLQCPFQLLPCLTCNGEVPRGKVPTHHCFAEILSQLEATKDQLKAQELASAKEIADLQQRLQEIKASQAASSSQSVSQPFTKSSPFTMPASNSTTQLAAATNQPSRPRRVKRRRPRKG